MILSNNAFNWAMLRSGIRARGGSCEPGAEEPSASLSPAIDPDDDELPF